MNAHRKAALTPRNDVEAARHDKHNPWHEIEHLPGRGWTHGFLSGTHSMRRVSAGRKAGDQPRDSTVRHECANALHTCHFMVKSLRAVEDTE